MHHPKACCSQTSSSKVVERQNNLFDSYKTPAEDSIGPEGEQAASSWHSIQLVSHIKVPAEK